MRCYPKNKATAQQQGRYHRQAAPKPVRPVRMRRGVGTSGQCLRLGWRQRKVLRQGVKIGEGHALALSATVKREKKPMKKGLRRSSLRRAQRHREGGAVRKHVCVRHGGIVQCTVPPCVQAYPLKRFPIVLVGAGGRWWFGCRRFGRRQCWRCGWLHGGGHGLGGCRFWCHRLVGGQFFAGGRAAGLGASGCRRWAVRSGGGRAHRLGAGPGAHIKGGNHLGQAPCLFAHSASGGRGLFDQGGVLLGHLVQVGHRLIDLANAGLFGAGR